MSISLIVNILLVSILFYILYHLGRALFILIKGQSNKPMSFFLGRRVFFSAAIMLLLMVLLASGVIEPNARPY